MAKGQMTHGEAYKQAGFSAPTERMAMQGGSRLLRNRTIKNALNAVRNKNEVGEMNIKDERILAELASVAFTSLGDLVDDNGVLKEWDDIPDHCKAAISSYKRTEGPHGPVVQVKLHDKLKGIEQLARIKGLVVDQRGSKVKVRVAFMKDQGAIEIENE